MPPKRKKKSSGNRSSSGRSSGTSSKSSRSSSASKSRTGSDSDSSRSKKSRNKKGKSNKDDSCQCPGSSSKSGSSSEQEMCSLKGCKKSIQKQKQACGPGQQMAGMCQTRPRCQPPMGRPPGCGPRMWQTTGAKCSQGPPTCTRRIALTKNCGPSQQGIPVSLILQDPQQQPQNGNNGSSPMMFAVLPGGYNRSCNNGMAIVMPYSPNDQGNGKNSKKKKKSRRSPSSSSEEDTTSSGS